MAQRGRIFPDRAGRPTRMFGAATDITERKQAEETQAKMEQQHRLASVGQLAAGIAHDFNNMLTVMVGHAQLLGMRGDIPNEAKVDLKSVYEQGQRAAQLIRQILDLSRMTVVERRPMDLIPFLKEAVKILERTLPETIRICLEIESEEAVVCANLPQLQEAITNFAVNARDAMPEGGDLRIGLWRLRLAPEERPPFPEMAAGEWAALSVADTGVGMQAEVMERIFDPFFTTKEVGKGTGLGLSQVYGIVKQHGGEIGVESQVGAGTTFTVYLPMTGEQEAPRREAETTVPRGSGELVLLVEDNPHVLQVAKVLLERLGYRVVTASNGREALEVYEANREEGVVLVLTDLVMPEMGGRALARALRERNPEMRVVFMTGYSPGGLRQEDMSAGETVVMKPLEFPALAQAIARALS